MMRLNLTVLTLMGLVTLSMASSKLLGSEKCTWGPSYWCSGLAQSAGCRATSHCIEKVWKSNPYDVDDDDVCTICKNMVAQARDQLESNETQTELKEVFEGSCQLIPIKIIANECIKLADQFVPELVETLASEMNPDTVCSVAGLCNSKRIDKLLAKFYEQHPPTYCDRCKSETRKISLKIRQMNKDQLVDKMLELCGHLSSYSDACKATVLDNFELIYSVLTTMDSGVCELMSVCGEGLGNQIYQVSGDDIHCQFCTKVIKHWIDTWTANTTEAEFKQVLEALCHKMHDEREAQCLHIVDDYYLPIFNYLAHQIDPRGVCAMFGLCDDGEFLKVSDESSITMLLQPGQDVDVRRYDQRLLGETDGDDQLRPKISFVGNDESAAESSTTPMNNVLVGGYFAPQTVLEVTKPGCVYCEYLMKTLEDLLKDKKTKESVEAAMDKICEIMPASLKDQCVNLVDVYGRSIVELLSNGIDPKEVCTLLTLCDKDLMLSQSQPESPVLAKIRLQSDNCAMCEYAVNTLFEVLHTKDDQDMIRNVLETLCSYMPSTISDKCETFVHDNIEKIIDMVVDNLTPDQICSALKMCAAKKQPRSESCVICEYVVQTLDSMLQNKTDRDSVKKALDNLCSYLPQTVSKECVTFVNAYADMIIDFITQGFTPDQVCQQLHLCNTNVPPAQDEEDMLVEVSVLATEAEVESETGNDKPYCLLCEYAITEVDKLLEDKKNEAEIKDVLDKICYELSAPIQQQCVKMISLYLDEIIDMFVRDYTPQQVCAELHLCQAKLEVVDPSLNEVSSQVEAKAGGPVCVLCEFAMSILEKQIVTNSTLDMIERSVLMLCSYMPRSVADQCEDFVAKYGDEIIKLIMEAEMSPEAICSALSLCSDVTLWDATPVGGRPCVWGPALWCASPVHAEACDTFEHCRKQGISFDD